MSENSSPDRAETIGNGSVASDLPRKLPFVPYFSLCGHWRFFQNGQNYSEGYWVTEFAVSRLILYRLSWLTAHAA
ncbi:MAG: hypothetical protein GY820_46760 [Gammaproteobacteria bacterium]|nr:hypothetical protein [Gammaproteobacteria bacterium]